MENYFSRFCQETTKIIERRKKWNRKPKIIRIPGYRNGRYTGNQRNIRKIYCEHWTYVRVTLCSLVQKVASSRPPNTVHHRPSLVSAFPWGRTPTTSLSSFPSPFFATVPMAPPPVSYTQSSRGGQANFCKSTQIANPSILGLFRYCKSANFFVVPV